MKDADTAGLLYQKAKSWPEALGAEVLDFMGYLRSRHPTTPVVGDQTAKWAKFEEFFRLISVYGKNYASYL